jgi:hypothetical protein
MCVGALAMGLVVLKFTDVLVSIGICISALAMELPVLKFTDVLVSLPFTWTMCKGAKAIMENVWWTRRKRINIPHQPQTRQQNKDAVHPQIIPLLLKGL